MQKVCHLPWITKTDRRRTAGCRQSRSKQYRRYCLPGQQEAARRQKPASGHWELPAGPEPQQQGEKHFLCRVFAGDFDAVILDEPTAFLDPLTEADILQEVLEATKGKLLIFVTHRLSFARQADQILYLKNGMIAEHGTHEELMEKGGDYCRMFTTQRRQYFAQEGENDAV